MKKKPIKIAYVALVLAVCAFPVFTMPLFGETASTEKRELAAFPRLTKEGEGFNLAFFSELNTYLSEHFSFRSQLVTADSVAKASLFGTSSEDQVIVVTDWGGSNDHVAGVEAGSTFEMPAPGMDSVRQLVAAVHSGRLSEEVLDSCVDDALELVLSTHPAVEGATGSRRPSGLRKTR